MEMKIKGDIIIGTPRGKTNYHEYEYKKGLELNIRDYCICKGKSHCKWFPPIYYTKCMEEMVMDCDKFYVERSESVSFQRERGGGAHSKKGTWR